jgi:putative oxidoreductase
MFNRIKSPTWVPVPLRLIVGLGFMEHGSAKLLKGPDAFAYILHGLGVPAPHFMAWLTILTELLGFAVLLGAFVTLVSVPGSCPHNCNIQRAGVRFQFDAWP